MEKITKEDIAAFNFNPTMYNYQNITTKSAIYPGQKTALGLLYCALKLNGEAGEIAEHVGKAMRDDGYCKTVVDPSHTSEIFVGVTSHLKETRHGLIIKEVGDVLWYLSAICNELGIDLQKVAEKNLIKLEDRTARGKLSGSGDNR